MPEKNDHKGFLRNIITDTSTVIGVFVGSIMKTCAEYCTKKMIHFTDSKDLENCFRECSEKIASRV